MKNPCKAWIFYKVDQTHFTWAKCDPNNADSLDDLTQLQHWFYYVYHNSFNQVTIAIFITCVAEVFCTGHNCSQDCVNINGAELCFCMPGYQLNMDNVTCSGMIV